jgi:hypothetical protein
MTAPPVHYWVFRALLIALVLAAVIAAAVLVPWSYLLQFWM